MVDALMLCFAVSFGFYAVGAVGVFGLMVFANRRELRTYGTCFQGCAPVTLLLMAVIWPWLAKAALELRDDE